MSEPIDITVDPDAPVVFSGALTLGHHGAPCAHCGGEVPWSSALTVSAPMPESFRGEYCSMGCVVGALMVRIVALEKANENDEEEDGG